MDQQSLTSGLNISYRFNGKQCSRSNEWNDDARNKCIVEAIFCCKTTKQDSDSHPNAFHPYNAPIDPIIAEYFTSEAPECAKEFLPIEEGFEVVFWK